MRLALASLTLIVPAVAHADTKPPMGATKVAIDYTYQSFHSNELHYKLAWDKTAYRGDNKVSVDAKLIEALYAALTDLKPFDDDVRCMSHTDDYPHFTITIEGDSPVVIDTGSNCHDNVPWNVIRNGKHTAQFNGKIPHAVYRLLAAVDSASWKTPPDSPEASTGFGGETVGIGAYSPQYKMASASAMACVKDEETSPVVRQAFGSSPKVNELSLECELGSSPDCSQLIARSEFAWDGVALQIGLACNAGVIDLPRPAVDAIAELRTFVDSKPMRTLVQMSGKTSPRVWRNGEWTSEGQFDDAPMVTFQPGTRTIHVRAIGESGPGAASYLKALGIDAKAVTKHDPQAGWYETDLDVDFNGKLVGTGPAKRR